MNIEQLLINHGYVNVGETNQPINSKSVKTALENSDVATIVSNFIYYGYIPNNSAIVSLGNMSTSELSNFWINSETALKEITGDNKNMGKYVVYKNFPSEVLNMSEQEYWLKQILMYFGFDSEHFTEVAVNRSKVFEKQSIKVLHTNPKNFEQELFSTLTRSKSKWSNVQQQEYFWIFENLNIQNINFIDFGFKDNAVALVKTKWQDIISNNINFTIQNATDIVRIAKSLSLEYDFGIKNKGIIKRNKVDVSVILNPIIQNAMQSALAGLYTQATQNTKQPKPNIQTKPKEKAVVNSRVNHFKNWTRKERKWWLGKLETSNNLAEDMARNKEDFKKFIFKLHPNDYKDFPLVKASYDNLYNNKLAGWNSDVETSIAKKDPKALMLLKTRPGEFMRRLHHLIEIFGDEAVTAFQEIIPKLSSTQLLRTAKYLEHINNRQHLLYPPQGNFTKAQFAENNKIKISDSNVNDILTSINSEIKLRVGVVYPNGVNLDSMTANIKLKENSTDLIPFGRGTTWDIPENITFARTASYWQITNGDRNTWYDNSWNFFDWNWKSMGACCWDHPNFMDGAAIFSGDPCNSKELEGKACQLIDIYFDKLRACGVKYAVFSVLGFSHIPFNQANEVIAAMQVGEKPLDGNLFEPARCQFNFPIKGDNLTKYIAYLDVENMKLVYIDSNLYGNTSSAGRNSTALQEKMPKFLEYIQQNPSIYDLFKNNHNEKSKDLVLYSDAKQELNGEKAWVFNRVNENNRFEEINIQDVLDVTRDSINNKNVLTAKIPKQKVLRK